MALKSIKMTVAVVWLLVAVAVAFMLPWSWTTAVAVVLLGLCPPIALLTLWKDPGQTMSERIRAAQR
ncbi:MAG: hypothetical protein R2752_10365 [Vicinamibacterales bacterium]